MILEIHGKAIAFGMQWRTLTGNAPAPDLAAKVAREVKANRIWHDGSALHMGYLAPEDTQTKVKDKLYSAAAAVARIPGLMPNVFFAYRLEHAGQQVGYLVCGVLKGRPRVGFDRVIHDEQALSEVVVEFARVAGGSFRLAGNLPELSHLLGNVPGLAFSALTLEQVADAADSHAALRKPSSTAMKRRAAALAVLALVAAIGGKYGMAQYRAYEARKHPPPPQKSPAQRYAEDILARGMAPSARASEAVPRFAKWFADTDALFVGGWKLTKVDCPAVVTPAAACSLTYSLGEGAKESPRGVTNATFLAALPDAFSAPVFSKEDKEVVVQADVPFGNATNLGALLDALPTSMALRTDFGSTLQLLRPAATKAVLGDIGLFGTIPGEGMAAVPQIYKIAPWEMDGPLRNAGEIATFPPNVAVSAIKLAVKLDAEPTIQTSKFEINVKGDAYARDGANQ
ncbi:ATPase [Cupriavidus plantarum]|uniref:ATPase n=1 Tax=Cupriavidus plantarum TaxID=942865 RepID=UPI00339DA340